MTNFNELSFAGILAKLVGVGSRIFDIERKEKDVGDSLREDFNGFLSEYLILAVQHVASRRFVLLQDNLVEGFDLFYHFDEIFLQQVEDYLVWSVRQVWIAEIEDFGSQ